MSRREQRLAVSTFRAHSHPANYQPKDGVARDIRFLDHHGIEMMGENDEFVVPSDAVEVMVTSLPEYEVGDKLVSADDGITYELGRTVKDDGYFKLIEVTF
jgi:hypothetical protein